MGIDVAWGDGLKDFFPGNENKEQENIIMLKYICIEENIIVFFNYFCTNWTKEKNYFWIQFRTYDMYD